MTDIIIRRVHKLDDLAVLNLFKDVEKLFGEPLVSSNLLMIPGRPKDIKDISESDLSGRHAFLTGTLHKKPKEKTSVSLNFRRSIKIGSELAPSPLYDEFEITISPNSGSIGDFEENVEAALARISQADFPSQILTSGDESTVLLDMARSFNTSHQKMLNQLSSSVTEIESKRLENDESAARADAAREEAHQIQLVELEKKKQALELQSHKATKRRLQAEMTKISVVERMKESETAGSIVSRWLVVVVSVTVAGFAGYSAINAAELFSSLMRELASIARPPVEQAESGENLIGFSAAQQVFLPMQWYLMGRIVVSSFVAIGGLLYAASWLKTIYRSEERTARMIDKFNYDVLRANWAIESYLEVENEYDGTVPDAWLESTTRGLFTEINEVNSEASQDLALKALLGVSSSAKVGTNGVELTMDKKGLKKMSDGSS